MIVANDELYLCLINNIWREKYRNKLNAIRKERVHQRKNTIKHDTSVRVLQIPRGVIEVLL